MTANQLADKLEQVYLNLTNAEFSYEDLELSAILTTAQQTYFARFFSSNGINQTGFEETEVRGWGFAPLISSATLAVSTDQIGVFTNGVYYDLPSDFQLMLTESPTSNSLVLSLIHISEPTRHRP
jgi:hypothetical protein